ncbi:MAG: DUF2799 domain-containing protein [Gammaproteobacteria bacterium]|nr:DUF2799 domain-containing protein [Gammaproteobacteria bacterium]
MINLDHSCDRGRVDSRSPMATSLYGTLVCCFGVLLLLLQSCSPISKADCLYADWYDKGWEDGAKGEPLSLFVDYSQACAKHGVTPDRAEYESGRKEGLKEYCTTDMGWEAGSSGFPYHNVCPSDLESAFLKGYEPGRKLYDAETNLKYIEDEITSSREQVSDLEQEIEELKEIVDDEDTDEGDRKIYSRRIKEHERRIDGLDDRIDELRVRRTLAQAEYLDALTDVKAAGFDVPLWRILDMR